MRHNHYFIITEEDVDRGRGVIDHADAAVAKMISDFGCIAGITVQPWRNLTPPDGAKIASEFPYGRVLMASDYSPLLSDPLSVPKTAHEMRRHGISKDDIKRIVFDNPCRIFGLGPR